MSTWPAKEVDFGPASKPKKLGRQGVAKNRHMRGGGPNVPGMSLMGFTGQIQGPISWGPSSILTLHKGINRKPAPAGSVYGKAKCADKGHRPLDRNGWCSRCHVWVAPPPPIPSLDDVIEAEQAR